MAAGKNASVCANKLLKLLEEPPEKTVFLLVSEAPDADSAHYPKPYPAHECTED